MKSRLSLLALSLVLCAGAAQAQQRPAAPAAPATANDGVISNPDFEKAGQTAAHAWLLLLDRRDWGTAWDASSNVFRQNVPLGAWMDNVPKLREPFGVFVERQPAESLYKKSLAGRPDGDYVTSHFVSKFDKKVQVIETVTTVREPDGRGRGTGYTARGPRSDAAGRALPALA